LGAGVVWRLDATNARAAATRLRRSSALQASSERDGPTPWTWLGLALASDDAVEAGDGSNGPMRVLDRPCFHRKVVRRSDVADCRPSTDHRVFGWEDWAGDGNWTRRDDELLVKVLGDRRLVDCRRGRQCNGLHCGGRLRLSIFWARLLGCAATTVWPPVLSPPPLTAGECADGRAIANTCESDSEQSALTT